MATYYTTVLFYSVIQCVLLSFVSKNKLGCNVVNWCDYRNMMQTVLSGLTTEPLQNNFFWQDILASSLLNCEEGVADEC